MSNSSPQRQFSYESFPQSGVVAYFSMEIAINPAMPTYSGGLGVLAGDTLRSTADLGTPLVAFTLVHRKGYFRQHLDNQGKEMHEFTAPEFFKAIQMRDTKALNADQTEIVVQPGQKKDLYFVAQQPGSFKLRCSDHDWAGMIGDITIAP